MIKTSIIHEIIAGIKAFIGFIFTYWYAWIFLAFIFLMFKTASKVDRSKYGKNILNFISVVVFLSLKEVIEIIKKLFIRLQQAGVAVRQQQEAEEAAKKLKEEKEFKENSDNKKADYIG